MKQKNRLTEHIINQVSERLPKTLGAAKPVGFDLALPALMATGLGGLVVATYDDAPDADTEETAAAQGHAGAETPPLTPFSDPILPPPPTHQPSQRDVFNAPEADYLALADLLPPVQPVGDIEWHHPLSPPIEHDLATSLLSLPVYSAAPETREETPPPLPSDASDENEEADMAAEDELMTRMGQDSPTASGGQHSPHMPDDMTGEMSDEMSGEMSGEMGFSAGFGFIAEADEMDEMENWQEIFGAPSIQQSQAIHLEDVFLTHADSEARKLFEIMSADPVLNEAGFTIEPNALLEIRNGNEVWLIGGLDLSDPSFPPQSNIRIYPLSDPSVFASFILYIDETPPDAMTQSQTQNAPYQDADPTGGAGEDPPLYEPEFEYHQGPDII